MHSSDSFRMNVRFALYSSILVLLGSFLTGCSSVPTTDDARAEWSYSADPANSKTALPRPGAAIGGLQSQLGLNRAPSDLGFSEKAFNPCIYGISSSCDAQYMTVVHFQLLCRDTEGTVSAVPIALTPIVSSNILWSVAGQSGGTPTDRNGYGHFSVITPSPLRGQRLILRNGRQYVGVSVNEVSKLVLPKNWCNRS